MKRRLNAYRQKCRINPDELEEVSNDKPEDPMPDLTGFLDLPQTIAVSQVPPNDPPSNVDLHPAVPNISGPAHVPGALNPPQVNWNDIVATTQSRPLGIPSPALKLNSPVLIKTSMNWDTLGPDFLDMEAQKNNHELNPSGIPDAFV